MNLTTAVDSPARPTTRGDGFRIRIAAATKRFGAATALSEVSLEVEPGSFTVLLGPSGSGKSTLIRTLAGIECLDEGTIHFDDTLMCGGGHSVAPEKRELSMVFQDYALWPHLTAQDNVGYALRRRRLGSSTTASIARETLDRVGMGHLARRYPHELSGGEQQRVALARAIAAQPRLLLFDEPLSNLDADLRERLRVEIATLTRASKCTAVYITHDQSEAFALADTIGVLHHGRLEQVGTPEQIYHHPRTPMVARFTGVSGELVGHVVRRERDAVVVGLSQGQILAQGRCPEGSAVKVLVRPAATGLTEAGADAAALPAQVIDVAYRGRGYDHVVQCDGARLTSVFDTRAWPRGSGCGLTLRPIGCLAYASDARDQIGTAATTPPNEPTAAIVGRSRTIRTSRMSS